MGGGASSGFRSLSLIPLRPPSPASSELTAQSSHLLPPKKPSLQEKAVGCAHTQGCLLYVKCFIWGLLGTLRVRVLRVPGDGPPFSVHWACFVRRKVALTKV